VGISTGESGARSASTGFSFHTRKNNPNARAGPSFARATKRTLSNNGPNGSLSGLRRGEIFGLKWKCIDWTERSILVSEASYEGHIAAPKTRASRRLVFVDETVLESLKRLRPAQCQPEDLVFCTVRGTSLNPNNVLNRVLHPACKVVGIPRVSWHNFRYTYSTWANPTGESIKALQAQLGHTDARLTLSVYTQPMPEAQKKLAGKIARVLLPDVPNFVDELQKEGALIQ
jgi:integrase